MKKNIILLLLLLFIPSILHAESSYFLACKDGEITDAQYNNTKISFKKGDIFEINNLIKDSMWIKSINKYKEGIPKKGDSLSKYLSECWTDSGEPICPLQIKYNTAWYKSKYSNDMAVFDKYGFVDMKTGCWFRSDNNIPFDNKKSKGLGGLINKTFIGEIGNAVKGKGHSWEEELFIDKTLDKKFVDCICSPHSTQFTMAGITFTDIKMEKSENHLKWVENTRLIEEDKKKEEAIKLKEAKEESQRLELENNWILFNDKNGLTTLFERGYDEAHSPQLYAFKNMPGYVFFNIRVEFPEDLRNKLSPSLKEDKNPTPQNLKIRYIKFWCRLNCVSDEVELIETTIYPDSSDPITEQSTSQEDDKFVKQFLNGFPFDKVREITTYKVQAKLGKHKVKEIVNIFSLEANPFKYGETTIAVLVKFQRMISRSSASFYSGYQVAPGWIQTIDQVIVSEIPQNTDFGRTIFPQILLIVKGKGMIDGTNAYGAHVTVPDLKYIDSEYLVDIKDIGSAD